MTGCCSSWRCVWTMMLPVLLATVAVEADTFAPTRPAGVKAPDGSPVSERPFTLEVPEKLLDGRGSLAFWFRPEKTLRGEARPVKLLEGEAITVEILPNSACVNLDVRLGFLTQGTFPSGEPRTYLYRMLLTHLKAGQWYHLALNWDAARPEQAGFFLDGVLQENPPLHAEVKLVPPAGPVTLTAGGPGAQVSAITINHEPLPARAIAAQLKAAGHAGYTDEGLRFTGRKLDFPDADVEHPVYATTFDDPAVLQDWKLEGGQRMYIEDGHLVLESDRETTRSTGKANHLVCWLTKEMPADFLLEFTVCPEKRDRGLNIVFFNARGRGGERIFDSALSPRDGTFSQYHSGDLDNYHISYWSGGRGTSNLRKNHGFHLAAVGRDLIETGKEGEFQTVRIYKRGGKVRLTVDGVLSLAYDDDGKTWGPIHNHTGWIGLRQMAHTQKCRYGYVKVYPLKE